MICSLDHLVLTVVDINATIDFYTNTLAMKLVEFGENRKALQFGSQKINLHQLGNEFEPKAGVPTPGSADLCFITKVPIRQLVGRFESQGVPIVEGPVSRTGTLGPIRSIYIRDPDNNLIELANNVICQQVENGFGT